MEIKINSVSYPSQNLQLLNNEYVLLNKEKKNTTFKCTRNSILINLLKLLWKFSSICAAANSTMCLNSVYVTKLLHFFGFKFNVEEQEEHPLLQSGFWILLGINFLPISTKFIPKKETLDINISFELDSESKFINTKDSVTLYSKANFDSNDAHHDSHYKTDLDFIFNAKGHKISKILCSFLYICRVVSIPTLVIYAVHHTLEHRFYDKDSLYLDWEWILIISNFLTFVYAYKIFRSEDTAYIELLEKLDEYKKHNSKFLYCAKSTIFVWLPIIANLLAMFEIIEEYGWLFQKFFVAISLHIPLDKPALPNSFWYTDIMVIFLSFNESLRGINFEHNAKLILDILVDIVIKNVLLTLIQGCKVIAHPFKCCFKQIDEEDPNFGEEILLLIENIIKGSLSVSFFLFAGFVAMSLNPRVLLGDNASILPSDRHGEEVKPSHDLMGAGLKHWLEHLSDNIKHPIMFLILMSDSLAIVGNIASGPFSIYKADFDQNKVTKKISSLFGKYNTYLTKQNKANYEIIDSIYNTIKKGFIEMGDLIKYLICCKCIATNQEGSDNNATIAHSISYDDFYKIKDSEDQGDGIDDILIDQKESNNDKEHKEENQETQEEAIKEAYEQIKQEKLNPLEELQNNFIKLDESFTNAESYQNNSDKYSTLSEQETIG